MAVFLRSISEEIYIGEQFITQMKHDFFNLIQGGKSVYDYECEFNKLARYASEMIPTERDICQKFIRGLRPRLKELLLAVNLTTFQEVSSSSFQSKRGRGSGYRYQNKTESGASSRKGFEAKEKGRQTQMTVSGASRSARSQDQILPCQYCGKNHPGVCRMKTGACFRCGDTNHFVRDCPLIGERSVQTERSVAVSQRGDRGRGRGRGRGYSETTSQSDVRAPARIYNIKTNDDRDDPEIIACTFYLYDEPVFVLIDSGSTRSYDGSNGTQRTKGAITGAIRSSFIIPSVSPWGAPVKAEHQVPSGLLQPISIPRWKWEPVTMDFVTGLPLTPSKKDSIWVIVDKLTKTTHFIPVREDYSMNKYAELYIREIV
ncbi:uncharacterized protein LOC120179386 [Hibiscus syriacus]|uniref:uncharacterized protein LOC120179386 n=1 Tax=Hibiscus syriacus TaxID=106335 RepID=UPI0019227C2F|nr:uncharacterized protein LOC120179386 [Hibiscus syriacus]